MDAFLMIIGICGIKRSASTWQHNCIRCALKVSGRDVWSGGPTEKGLLAARRGDYDDYVVKEHRWHEALAERADYIFTSSRPLEQVKESMWRFRGWRPSDEVLGRWEDDLFRWMHEADYHLRFKDLLEDARREAKNHIEVLPVAPEIDVVMRRIKRAIEPPEDKRQDPDSLIFEDHYTSFDPEQIASQHEP